jgi:two-component system, NtrC family, sensor kinase
MSPLLLRLLGTRSGTARRLALAFAALVALFVVATAIALLGFSQVNRGLARTRARVDSMRLALDLASAVRDQYAHQAHTIIIGNDSHLGFYAEAKARVLTLIQDLRRRTERPDERAWVDDIEAGAAELDRVFSRDIVPAVLSGRTADAHLEHAHALAVVSRIQQRTDLLAKRFEDAIGELQSFAQATRDRTVAWSMFFLVMAPLLAGGVAVYLGRKVARPVALLHAGAERLAAGDLDTRIVVGGDDEFGDLARQFNTMVASLKEQQHRLLHSERLASVGRLAAGVAHEINNPLGVILGYTRLLRKQAVGPLAADLAVVEEEVLRCQEIVEGLLDFSRPVQAGTQPVDLRALCDDVVARLAEASSTPGVTVTVAGQGGTTGTASKLRQVLLNLIKNAIEAAAPVGRVDIQVDETHEFSRATVRDSGPGLDAEARDRLFEPFFTNKPRGTGLGLAVSQAIAHAHGGEIVADPPGPGGACFVVRLPRVRGETT